MSEEQTSMSAKLNGKKWGIIGAVLLILIALIIGISIYNSSTNRLSRQLDLGNRYLEEQNYEQAIVEFDKAIAIDPMSVDAYLGKAEAYIGMGDLQSALDTLQAGYDLTGDERLKTKLDEIQAQLNQASQLEEIEKPVEEAEVQEEQEYIELPFSMSDITIRGYSFLDMSAFDEIVTAFGCSMGEDYITEYGFMRADRFDDTKDHFQYTTGGGGLEYDVYPDRASLYLHDSVNSDRINEYRDALKSICNVPLCLGATYDEWCEKLEVEAIKSSLEERTSEWVYTNDSAKILTEDEWYVWMYEESKTSSSIIFSNKSGSEHLSIEADIEDGIIVYIVYWYMI